jgi:hypothetical protein
MTTTSGGPTFRVSAGCDDAIVMLGHDEATCHECQSAREREEAMLREEQLLDVQTSGLDK